MTSQNMGLSYRKLRPWIRVPLDTEEGESAVDNDASDSRHGERRLHAVKKGDYAMDMVTPTQIS